VHDFTKLGSVIGLKKRKLVASVVSTLLLSSSIFSSAVIAEDNKKLLSAQQVEIGKDYVSPKVIGEWIYNSTNDTFSWGLNWERITYAKGYKIYRKAEGEEYQLITTIDKEKTVHYVDQTFEFGNMYTYRLTYLHGNREIDLAPEIKADYKLDSDGDGIYDLIEAQKGADPFNSDTDGDGLLDGFETVGTRTNFLLTDTDNNGTPDGKEDSDQDGLDNFTEKELNTNPRNEDTDSDQVVDGDEVEKGTDPKNSDTDGDGLEDGFEPTVGLNPLKADTDGNGVLDGEEQVEATTTVEEPTGPITPSVTIESTAKEAGTTTITSMDGEIAALGENLPGYLGAPFEFETDVNFQNAKMTFAYDESLKGESFKPAIYYFNEETQMLEKVANQTIDEANGTVTANVSHFSIYILLNEMTWEEAWEKEMKTPIMGEDGEGNTQYIDVVFSIDSSGSMEWNDPQELRKEAAKSFVDKLREHDQAAVVDFDDWARTLVSLTTDHAQVKYQIDTIDDWGGTNLYAGLSRAVDEVSRGSADHNRFVIFLTDGDGYWHESALDAAKANNVTVYTIGLGPSLNENLLKRIATETGGRYFHASNASELQDIHDDVADETVTAKDTDGDGLADVTEKWGYRTETGEWISNLNFENPDTDGDGIKDGAEAGQLIPGSNPYYFTNSNPTKKDTDDDGIHDNTVDCQPLANVTECRDLSPKKYQFNPFIATLMTDMSYVDMEGDTKGGKTPYVAKENYFGGIVTELSWEVVTELTDRLKHNEADRDLTDIDEKWDAAKRYLRGWKLIKAEDSAGWDSGLAAMALKKGNTVVIAYRGSETGFGGYTKDWLGADLQLALAGNNVQVPGARDFAYDVILDNPTADIYVLGHSLGGFLAQIISYEIIEEKIDNAAFWWFNENKLQDILDDNPDMFKRGLTFNAAPFTHYNLPWIDAVPHDDAKSNDYDHLIYNYGIDSDPLSEAVYNGLAVRIGSEIPELDYAEDDAGVSFNAHIMVNFYQHFK
jgi:hypothetical protein